MPRLRIALRAATITQYNYSGDTYSAAGCLATYCTGGPYALTVTSDTSLRSRADSLGYNTDITPDITSFSISDGSGFGLTQSTASSYNFQIGTDSSGNIDWWQINVALSPPPYFEPGSSAGTATFLTYYYPNYPQILDRTAWSDGSVQGECFNYGSVVTSGCLGNWTMQTIGGTTGAPEPSSGVLVGAGFLGLLGFLVRRKVASPAR